MPGIPFAKAHALGNDFLLVEEVGLGGRTTGELARRACDRHAGIGADGLVILGPSRAADATFRIYNADGGEAALSGNALRCAAAWLVHRRRGERVVGQRRAALGTAGTSASEVVSFDTRLGLRRLFFLGRENGQWLFRAEIGSPAFAAAEVPFRPPRPVREPIAGYLLPAGDELVPVTILSMGNPQCIVFVDDFALFDWQGLGAEIERHPYFPERTNVGFARVLSAERIEARFWERGAGHTLASGTGACGCVVAAHLAGKTGRRVTVAVARGEMEVNWRDDNMVELIGPAEIVCEGTYAG